MQIDVQKEETASELRGSLYDFTRFFYKYIYNRDYIESHPIGRESHQIVLCRALTKLTRQEIPKQRLAITLPPGTGKTMHICMWIAWCYTQYPDSNFMYISYSHDLAAKHTSFIKNLMSSRMYQYLFDIQLRHDSRAKDHFTTTQGGCCAAFGSAGAVTGRDAGLPGLERFSGALILDDPIKPDEAHSDTIRKNVKRNYEETIRQRTRGFNVPIVFIGQRIHEDDLAAFLLSGEDTREWESIILKGLDEAGNALYPEVMPRDELLALQDKSPYVFASQYQQDPLPAGGGIFKESWFQILDEEPNILTTFITADTAETNKSYNDATVFSFWGLYEITNFGTKTGIFGLHWIDCVELRIEPKDLREEFISFWQECLLHSVPPKIAAIERKSTGVTLVNILQYELRGINIRNIERNAKSGSKADRFIAMQPFIASKLISFTNGAKHVNLCIEHMKKITLNNSHRFDDIADTCADAIKLAFIEKSISPSIETGNVQQRKLDKFNQGLQRRLRAGVIRNGRSS